MGTELYWNPWGVPGLLAMALALAAAWFVYYANPAGSANRRLALVLFFEGAAIGGGAGIIYFMGEPREAYAAQVVSVAATLLLPSLNLYFLSILDTPLVRPLRSSWGRITIWSLAVAAEVVFFANKRDFIPGTEATWYARWDAIWGPPYVLFRYFALLVLVFALIASVDDYRRATAELARKRAKAFVMAFGARDLGSALLIVLLFVLPAAQSGGPAEVRSTHGVQDLLAVVAFPILIFLYIPLLAYGILRTQLFDIDFHIKLTFRQSTIAAIFVAVFFTVSELAQTLFSSKVGPYMGIGAAGLLVFAIHPVQQFAERLANAAMPHAKPLSKTTQRERVELFREQVRFAWSDGTLSRKERMMLDTLRQRLSLSHEDAFRVETDVAGSGPGFLGGAP